MNAIPDFPFDGPGRTLCRRWEQLTELLDQCPGKTPGHASTLRGMQDRLQRDLQELRQQLRQRSASDPAPDTRHDARMVLCYFDNYWENPCGHELRADGTAPVAARTSAAAEQRFAMVKREGALSSGGQGVRAAATDKSRRWTARGQSDRSTVRAADI